MVLDISPIHFQHKSWMSVQLYFLLCQIHLGKTYRYMSAERVVQDIEFMIKHHGARGIYFREDHFTLNKQRTIDFCESLLKKNIEIDWFCETRVDQLDDFEYQKLMKDAGCRVFYIGVESGSPRMLEFYKKGETREAVYQSIRDRQACGNQDLCQLHRRLPHRRQKKTRH